MAPTTLANTNTDVNNALSTGAANQAALNTQSGQLQGQYGTDVNNANTAGQTAAGYVSGIQNAGTNYGTDLTAAQNMYGFNPSSLALANTNLLNTQTALNYAPQSAQQAGNYYGTTAGQTQNAYNNMAGNLNTTLGNQTNAVAQYQNLLAATQQQANQQSGLTLQSQTAQATAAESQYQNSVSQMQAAGSTMASIENLAQQQGYLTSEQVANYTGAYNNYLSAQQAASQAQLNTQSYNNTQALQTQLQKIYGNNWSQALADAQAGKTIPTSLLPSTPKTATTTAPTPKTTTATSTAKPANGNLFAAPTSFGTAIPGYGG